MHPTVSCQNKEELVELDAKFAMGSCLLQGVQDFPALCGWES